VTRGAVPEIESCVDFTLSSHKTGVVTHLSEPRRWRSYGDAAASGARSGA
jgi:hypothetical protein